MIHLLGVMEVEAHMEQSLRLGDTAAAAGIAFLFYPTTIAAIGIYSNGGVLGFGSLVIASLFAWRALVLNMRSSWLRRLLQLPLAALVTFMAILDAYAQSVTRWWWGF